MQFTDHVSTMAALANASCSRTTSPAVSPLSSPRAREPLCCLPSNPSFFRPNFTSNQTFKIPRIKISRRTVKSSNHISGLPLISCLVEDNFEVHPNSNDTPPPNHLQDAGINIKLPRRSLLVQFTCNACGVRSQKLVNRLAFERGTVFVQCSGCFKHHKLVDNLGLVIEYDLREDVSVEPSEDED